MGGFLYAGKDSAMKWSLKVGTVSGIDIKVHFTFIFVVIWAAAQGASGMGGSRGALFASLAILLLFVCVTLHELGHSLVALRLGIRVKDITLLPIGGLAQLESPPERPLQELLITLAGPMVNFGLAIGLALLLILIGGSNWFFHFGYVPHLLMGPRSPLSLLVYLLGANLVLGVFNLIPAFPMDGGRVLRAILAMWISYPRATRIAVRVGQVMAVGLALAAFSPIGNWSLALVALFVFTGASYEDQAVRMRPLLRGLRVRHALPTRMARAVTVEDTLSQVMELSFQHQQRDFPVVRDGLLVGILSQAELLAAMRQGDGDLRAEQTMRRHFPTVSPDDLLLHAQQLIAQTGLSALPVFDQGHFLGLISLEDINRAYTNLSWRR
jgi:Zn-dependent protease/CBS domain-containing protein